MSYLFKSSSGRSEATNVLKTTQVVKDLAASLLKDPTNPPVGYHIFTDRYYTSPELAIELLQSKMVITGTVMATRKCMPNELKKPKMKRGDCFSFRNKEMLALSWKDKRVVTMLSTKHSGNKEEMTLVPSKYASRPPTLKPNVVVDYTQHMGGVDRSDHYIANYQFMRRTRKWTRKLFFWLLEVSIVNSYLLYVMVQQKEDKKPVTHKKFRKCLVLSLIEERLATTGRKEKGKRGRPSSGPPEQRLDGKPHFIGKRDKGSGRCFVCHQMGKRKETMYFCKTCDKQTYLHPDICFQVYHTQKNVKSLEI